MNDVFDYRFLLHVSFHQWFLLGYKIRFLSPIATSERFAFLSACRPQATNKSVRTSSLVSCKRMNIVGQLDQTFHLFRAFGRWFPLCLHDDQFFKKMCQIWHKSRTSGHLNPRKKNGTSAGNKKVLVVMWLDLDLDVVDCALVALSHNGLASLRQILPGSLLALYGFTRRPPNGALMVLVGVLNDPREHL